ncbi:peptidoglycan DD-metalloendopeptidase family protein [Rhizomonospora bruguierae]|uniref:peptidoglycan DD-metalloendopeptidase family protein n=1 Tax=Rhizomonospora bruguierae TaxID=1581705 RepID=UPI001BCFC389
MTAPMRAAARAGRPGRRFILLISLTVALALLCCGGTVVGYFLGGLGGSDEPDLASTMGCGEGDPIDPNAKMPSISAYGPEQMRNAAIIINVGKRMGVPPRGWVVAVATAMQESRLTNLGFLGARNDHDSIGLFQQRPSMGWGTVEQIRDPAYAARKFYEKLVKIKGWESMALTDAAQQVQRSAYPDAYAKHEPVAAEIVNRLANGAAKAVQVNNQIKCASGGQIAASGWTIPARATVGSGFRTADRPGHDGVDLIAGRRTPIFAAASGRVIMVRCNASRSGRLTSCDEDGSPSTQGCGWYVDILHAGNYITRYCHQLVRPLVHIGQMVRAGQQIGIVGTSGHSSGPHLHFEVHINGDRSPRGAIDPVPFMRQQGAPLEQQP